MFFFFGFNPDGPDSKPAHQLMVHSSPKHDIGTDREQRSEAIDRRRSRLTWTSIDPVHDHFKISFFGSIQG